MKPSRSLYLDDHNNIQKDRKMLKDFKLVLMNFKIGFQTSFKGLTNVKGFQTSFRGKYNQHNGITYHHI